MRSAPGLRGTIRWLHGLSNHLNLNVLTFLTFSASRVNLELLIMLLEQGLQEKIKLVPIDLQNRPAWYKEKVYSANKVWCNFPFLFFFSLCYFLDKVRTSKKNNSQNNLMIHPQGLNFYAVVRRCANEVSEQENLLYKALQFAR